VTKTKKITIGELFNLATENFARHNPWFNQRFLIVKGGHSRSVLKNFEAEAISYGVGFKGFVAIYKNKAGFLKATGYELYWIYSGFSKGKFVDLPILEADNMIKETNTFSEKQVCPNILEISYRKPPIRTYKHIGSIRYVGIETPYTGFIYDRFELVIEQFKNGRYRGLLKSNRRAETKVILEYQVMDIIDKINKFESDRKVLKMTDDAYEELIKEDEKVVKKKIGKKELVLLHNDIPEEVVEEMQERQLVRRLKNG
jgi:hypothetical protein